MDENLIKRLESALARLEMLSAAGVRSAGAADVGEDAMAMDPSIIAFDDLISQSELACDFGPCAVVQLEHPQGRLCSQYVNRLTSAGKKIGEQVLNISKIIEEAFFAQKELLVKIKRNQKPDMEGLVKFLNPLNDVIKKATALTEGRRSDFFHHLKTSADSLTALAWTAYTGKDCGMSTPIAHVEESWEMAEFYCNKVLMEYRNKDANQVEWAKALKDLYVPGLRDYVRSHYPLGPVWNATGKTAASAPPKAPTRGPGAPAPPPPPPASLFSSETPQPSSSHPKEGMAAVFQEINSGKSVTSGLRKVTNDMKTKNRAGRTGVVSVAEKGNGGAPSLLKAGPPKFELQMGRKWVVENQIGQKNLLIKDCDSKQSVYIFGCKDSVVQIQGKVNNITIDKCTKMGLVFMDVVAACEIVNCSAVEVQCQGSAPTISVDNTAGCQLYLSKDSLEAKSSEINVLVPGSGPESDWGEHSLPQQYVHAYKDGHFETIPVSHSGA